MDDDLLAKSLKDNQSTGLGYLNPTAVTPPLSNDYFKMQMLKPGETENKDMFMGMNPTEWSSAMKAGQLGLGGANLGLGVLSYLNQKDLADKQKKVLGQQIESNRAEIDARKNYRSALEKF